MIRINGKVYNGNSVSVIGDQIYIDGKLQGTGKPDEEGILKIIVEGDAVNVTSKTASIQVNGNVLGDADAGSYIICGDVMKSADAGSYIKCKNVGKNVDAGSYVQCGKVKGNIDAGTYVRHQ